MRLGLQFRFADSKFLLTHEFQRSTDQFARTGPTHLDLTHIDIEGEKKGFRP